MKDNNASFVANYEIKGIFYESSDGVVYLAVKRESNLQVLIKTYYPALFWPAHILDEFHRQIEYLRYVVHDNFLPIIDVGNHEGAPYVVFADQAAKLLIQHAVGQPNDQSSESLAFLRQIANAIEWMHKQKIFHGSLNMANIAIDETGRPFIFDFGLSSILTKLLQETIGAGFDLLSNSDLKCTSPEQIQGLEPTPLSDMYSFGVISYYYLTGEYPFIGQDTLATAALHVNSRSIAASKAFQRLSIGMAGFLQKCLQIRPENRFVDFTQVVKSLDGSGYRRVRLTFEKRFVVKRFSKPSRRRVLYGAVAIIVAAALWGGYYLSQKARPFVPSSNITAVSITPIVPTLAVTLQPTQPGAMPGEDVPTVVPTSVTIASLESKPFIQNQTAELPQETISLENISNLREISRLGSGKPEDVALSPDNVYMAIATSSGVYIYQQDQVILWIDPKGWATSVQFAPDGKTLAIGLESGQIQLWDWENEIQTGVLFQHKQRIVKTLFAENDYMYSASVDAHIVVWDWKAGTIRRSIPAHSKPINDIAISRDGHFIISCAEDRLIRIWDVDTGLQILDFYFDDQKSMVNAVAISSDAKFFAAGGESGFVRQWDMITKPNSKLEPRTDAIPVGEQVWSLQYTQNDANLLIGTYQGGNARYESDRVSFPLIDFQVQKPARDLVDIFGPAFEFDSTTVFDGSRTVMINWDGTASIDNNQLLAPMYDILDRLDLSPDGMKLAVGGKRGFTQVWDLSTGKILYRNFYEMPYGDPIAPDGSAVAVIIPTTLNTLPPITQLNYQMTQLTDGNLTWDLSQAIEDGYVSYALSGEVIIAGSMLASRSWDFDSGSETYSNGYQYIGGCRITVSSNDEEEKLQVASPLGTFEWIPSRSEKLCPVISGFAGVIATFSRDQMLFVRRNTHGLLEGYDVENGKVRWTHPLEHEISSLAISPDGMLTVYGDGTGTLTFLNSLTGDVLGTLTGNFGAVTAIEFSDDGREFVTGGQDGTARIFGIINR